MGKFQPMDIPPDLKAKVDEHNLDVQKVFIWALEGAIARAEGTASAREYPRTARAKADQLPSHLEAKVAEYGLDAGKIFVRALDEAVKDAAWLESMKKHLRENRAYAGWTPSPKEVVRMIREARESR